jgi:competence protein ComEA
MILKQLTIRERLALGVVLVVVMLGSAGGWYYKTHTPPPLAPITSQRTPSPSPIPKNSTILKPSAISEHSATPMPTATPSVELVVYVSGSVRRPGVFRFKSGQRLYEAIEKAGGFLAAADRDALNLADHLQDADQIHVPEKSKPGAIALPMPKQAIAKPMASTKTTVPLGARRIGLPQSQSLTAEASHSKLKAPGEGVINLNTASLDELQRLPGIGPSMAQRIVDYRAENGRFMEIGELQEVKGIGEKKFEKVKAFLAV